MSQLFGKQKNTPAERLARLKRVASGKLAPGLPGPAEYLARDPELREELERERTVVNAAAPPAERSDPGSNVIPAPGAGIPSWEPRSKPQEMLLKCPAQLVLFGGSLGSLKSESMLVDAVLERENPNLRAIMLRRTFPELDKSLIRRSHELYGAMGAKYNDQKHAWKFPSGAIVEFGYCEREKDIFKYQGAQFSYIGFDESTHFSEEQIRYLTSRLRSTDPSLFLRVRLATNPGNVGHVFHRSIFQGPKCLHCLEQERETLAGAREPFRIYDDARWPSDGRLIGFSTCFIPGRLTDHTLLGPEYARTVEGLSAKFREALLAGCWGAFEGQYFECWNQSRMVIPASEIPVQAWWPHWVGADYGFSISQAAGYLLCRSEPCDGFPRGRVYVRDEYTSKHEPAPDFARSLWRSFAVRHGTMTEPQRIVAWYLSPDAFSNRGDANGHTLADQMYQGSGVGFQAAVDDRVAGAMLMYTMLNSGELLLSDKCPQLAEALQTRIHDPNRNDDILKVKGDPLDDCADALRYGCLSHVGPARRTAEQIAAEAQLSPDPTIAMLQSARAKALLTDGSQGGCFVPYLNRGPQGPRTTRW